MIMIILGLRESDTVIVDYGHRYMIGLYPQSRVFPIVGKNARARDKY